MNDTIVLVFLRGKRCKGATRGPIYGSASGDRYDSFSEFSRDELDGEECKAKE